MIKLLRPALFLLVSTVLVRAQTTTLLNDTFADSERVTQNLPASLAWFTTAAASTNLAVRNGALTMVANDRDRPVWGYFPTVNLGIGDSLTLTVDFRLTRNQQGLGGPAFVLALGATNGLALRNSDGGTPTGRYQGYGHFTNPADATGGTRLRKRSGPAAANTTATLLEVTDGATDIVWEAFGAARTGLSGAWLGNTPYTAVLKITRTGPDSAEITTTVTGGGLPAINTLTEIDSAGIFTNFDTLAIGAGASSNFGDQLITRVQLDHDINSTRLINLSILTAIPASGDSFTMGYVVGGSGTSGTKPLVIRVAGPSLGALGVPGTLDDPKLELFAGTTKTGENDNWGGGAPITDAMAAVGAFAFASPGSRDAASVLNVSSPDNSVKVSAASSGSGTVIAEIYDATPAARFNSSTPRLVNVSVLKHLGAGLTVGFVVGGSGTKNVLVRAVGPALGAAPFNVPGVVSDPQLTLFAAGQVVVGSNDNWGGTPPLTAAFARIGAFSLPAASRDAALVAALLPGSYTVQVTGVGATTGIALVEVYELP